MKTVTIDGAEFEILDTWPDAGNPKLLMAHLRPIPKPELPLQVEILKELDWLDRNSIPSELRALCRVLDRRLAKMKEEHDK